MRRKSFTLTITLTSELMAFPTPGHTPGHMSVLVSSQGEKAIITGDVLANPAQVTNPDWVFGFDMDPGSAVETRTALLDRIEAEGLKIVTCHFPAPGAGTIIRVEGRRYFLGVDVD
jgi:glyoxylase-like metal-dependent hydrolase (beta-lactamase superfamily II)